MGPCDDIINMLIAQVAAIEAELVSIQTELGVNPQGIYANVRVRLDVLESRINSSFMPSANVANPVFLGTSGVSIQAGTGDPSVVIISPPNPGSLYLRQDGANNTVLYGYNANNMWSPVGAVGPAGGDLGGTYPNPSVVNINGTSVPASPSANQVLVATSGTAATWQQISNAQISVSAAIAGTKISPNFGAQNIVTTGTLSAGATTTTSIQDTSLSAGVVHSDGSGNLTSSLVVNADVSVSAAIAVDKLAAGTAAQLLLTNGTPIPTWTTMSGDAVIGATGIITVSTINGHTPITNTTAAGGDLSGTYPNPTVAKVNGVSVSGTPSAGQVIQANSPTTASWQSPAASITLSGDVTGPAGSNILSKIDGYTLPSPNGPNNQLSIINGSLAWTNDLSINVFWQQANWFIDPQNISGLASDNNTGLTRTTPLLTYAEVARRWGTYSPRIRQTTTITFMSSHTDNTDPVYLSPYLEGFELTLTGDLLVAQQIATGTLGTVVSKNRNTNQLLTAVIPTGATSGLLISNTTHTSYAWIGTLVTGTTYNISQPMIPNLQAISAVDTWATGDSYVIYQPVSVNLVSLGPTFVQAQAYMIYSNITIYDPAPGSSDPLDYASGVNILALQCTFQRRIQYSTTSSYQCAFQNCDFGTSSGFVGGGITQQTDVFSGQSRGASFDVPAADIDGDFIFYQHSSIYLTKYGCFYIGSGCLLNVAMAPVANATPFGSGVNGGVSVIWGPGTFNLQQGTLLYPTGAGQAVITFKLGVLNINNLTTAMSSSASGLNVLTLTAANLDATAGTSGFGGNAFVLGVAGISNSTAPVGFNIQSPLINVTNINFASSPYSVLTTDNVIGINTSGGNITVVLPSAPVSGTNYHIKDTTGNASTNNVTINGNGHNIDGSSTYSINTNYASVDLVFNGTTWSIL